MEERFQHLLAINRAIAEKLDYNEVLGLVVEKTAQLLAARECVLLLRGEDGLARVAAAFGVPVEKTAGFAAALDERIHVALRELLSHREPETFLGAPVIQQGELTGILAVHRRDGAGPDPDEETILSALADQTAIALDRASRYRELWLAGEHARRELEAAARRKDEFLATLSHELRNPLAAIGNAVALLRHVSPDDANVARVYDVAARQTQHMKRLLDDLLDVSRVTRDHIAIERRPVVLQELAQQALQGSAALVAERRHQLVMELAEHPVVVEGDADRLVQVISNLVTNAAKYTNPGGHLILGVAREGGEAVLRVRDDGIGIAAELLPTIFDLFVQAKRSVGRRDGGLGIGLSLVKRLVEMHGGTVSAASAGADRGSEFVVRLPLAHAGAVVPERAPRGGPSPPRRILLVEDNDDVAEPLAQALRGQHHEVTVFRDGASALRDAERRLPDVMLVDIGLPGIDGYEVARQMRARAPQDGRLPLLVAITGYGTADDRQRARDAGFDHHLVKPVELDQISRLLAADAAAR